MQTLITASLHSPDIKCPNPEKHSHARLHKVKKRLCHVSSQRPPPDLLWSTLMTEPYSSSVKVKFIRRDTRCDKKKKKSSSSYLIKILSYKSSRRSKKQLFCFICFFSPPRKCWIKPLPLPSWSWNTRLLSLSLPQLSLPVPVRIQAGIQEMRSCTTKLSFFFCCFLPHTWKYTVADCLSLWIPLIRRKIQSRPQRALSGAQGEPLTGGAVLSAGKVTVCHKGTVEIFPEKI